MTVVGTQGAGTPVRGLSDRLTVVGVVRDPAGGRDDAGDSEIGAAAYLGVHPKMWVPLAQHPSTRVVIFAKARASAAAVVPLLQREAGDAQVSMIAAQPLAQLVSFPLAIPRATGRAMWWGGAFALILSFLGIYGIVSFTVTERSREMAIRKAIGARPEQVVGRVLRHGLGLAAWGIGLGLSIAIPSAIALRSELAAVRPWDPVSVGTGVSVVLLAAVLASALPARRLAAIDPMTVLRDE